MRQYERSGVTVDQCLECRGIFLDRGELERVMDAEAAWNRNRQPATPPPPQPSYPPAQPYQPQSHGYSSHGSHGYGHYGHHKRHKRHHRDSFFGELFD
ncbi:hypothetical protein GCM10007977_098950 [Dactylosporangium sucinum]|uniref:Transcription factor zinc-finger domain-containing protein n=2 Tax=Dactylosporangium sucinum TaxID=1424081 RepID=A0A917UCT1_9ACTN|nr:hypothetical protein GCM10007977_098950 [Dactylosporangium sucinum]